MKRRALTIFLISCISISMLLAGITYAWLSKDQTRDIVMTMGDISQGIYIEFNGSNGNSYFDSTTNTLVVDGTLNNTSENNISNMMITVYITPEIASYFRIKVLDEWHIVRTYKNFTKQTEEVIAHYQESTLFPFTLADESKWYFNYEDGYLYYNELLEANQAYEIAFINGGDYYSTKNNRIYYEICNVYLNISLDSVQANRYHEIWGVDDTFITGGGA